MKLQLSAQSHAVVSRLITQLPQAVALTGESGIGLCTIAADIAAHHGVVEYVRPQRLTKTSTTEQIGIGQIRSLYERTRGKATSQHIIVVDDADTMTTSAQNTFLKLLEEPTVRTSFILTTHHPEKLLLTIRSRVRLESLSPLSETQTDTILESLAQSEQKRKQLSFMAGGLPAELYRLANDEAYYRRRSQSMEATKRILGADKYLQIQTVYKSATGKSEAIDLIDSLLHVLKRFQDGGSIRRIERLVDAREAILANGNPRLQLMAAML